MKKNKGITLIALIITVILMLILASVALSAIGTGDLFQKTQETADSYKEKADEEKALLESLINSVEKYAYSANNNQEPDAPVIVVDIDKPSIETFDVQLKARGDDSYTFTVTLKASDATSNIKFFELYCGYYQDDAMYVEELATPTKNVNISKDIVISDHADSLESLLNTSWDVVVYDSATEPNFASATFDVQEPEITTFTARFGSYCDSLPEDNYDEITVTGIGKASPIVSYEMYFVAQDNGGSDEEFYGMLDFSTLKKSESSIKTYSSNMGLEKLALSSEPIVLAEADGTQPEIIYSGTNVPYEEGTYNFNIIIEEDHANWYDGYDKDFYIKITFADGSYIEKTIVPEFSQGC